MTITATKNLTARTFVCTKCNGTGQYRHFGGCFECDGTGRVNGPKSVKFSDLDSALECLRRFYRAEVTGEGHWSHFLSDSSAYASGAFALSAVLFHGDVQSARKIVAAFGALNGRGGHFANYCASVAVDMDRWQFYPADAQRVALELAGVSAPITRDKRGWRIPATTWSFAAA
jgi:hypothetical protein